MADLAVPQFPERVARCILAFAAGPSTRTAVNPFPSSPSPRDFGQIQHTHPTLRLTPGRTARPNSRFAVQGPIYALSPGLTAASATDGALDPLEPHHNPSPRFRSNSFDSTVVAHGNGDMPFQHRLPRHQAEAQTPVTRDALDHGNRPMASCAERTGVPLTYSPVLAAWKVRLTTFCSDRLTDPGSPRRLQL